MSVASDRRRRATRIGIVAAVASIMVTVVAAAAGASVLFNSTQGKSTASQDLESRPLPQTPNVLLGVTTDDGELASAAVLTLSPSGQGGSVVTLPVEASATRPTSARPATTLADSVAADGESGFELAVTSLLGVSFDQVVVVDRDELAALLEPVGPVQVDLPADVVADSGGTPTVVTAAGQHPLQPEDVAEALASVWPDGSNGGIDEIELPEGDENTEALWDGVAGGIGGGLDTGAVVGIDVPEGLDNFLDRLFNGPVSVRRIASELDAAGSGPAVSILSRTDVLLVFGQISPRKVAAPLDSISVRVVVPFNDEDVSNSKMALAAIDRLTFSGVNVVSVSTSASADGAPDLTEVQLLNPNIDAGTRLEPTVGELRVVDAEYDIPGVDAVITVGESALSFYDVG